MVNLGMAVTDIYTGRWSPGDFVLLQTLFMQMAAPLFNMGTLLRQMEETKVETQELY